MSIKVSLISKSSEAPTNLISLAAKTCYSPELPKMGDTIDVEKQLFKTGHHTTIQHTYFTFTIDGLSVNACTFGLHLVHPFYTTDQRSGRYSKMYKNPDFDELKQYILFHYPEASIEKVMDFIKQGREIYKHNMKRAEELVKKTIKEERPFATDNYIDAQANKIAQEQMRMFLSTIFPTALVYTINLSTLTAMYRSAWSPELRNITQQMKEIVLKEYPDLKYMFGEQRETNWYPKLQNDFNVLKTPYIRNIKLYNYENGNHTFTKNEKDAVDLKYFTPENMDNNTFIIRTDIEVSIATMGQDQRHRTIKRGTPLLTGHFYLPPILDKLGLEKEALEYIKSYGELYNSISQNLAVAVAPYGVMVRYQKVGDINAIIHEQEKRLCWSAQEEIYNLSRQFHVKLLEGDDENSRNIAKMMYPACYSGKCIEGARYCGRDVAKLKEKKEMPIRCI